MHVTGRCHCGHVTYEAEIDAAGVGICHCTDCQKLTGSPFRVTAPAPQNAIKLTGAQPKLYRKVAENGHYRLQYFCGECGSPLFTAGEGDDADSWGIRWGSIDQRDQLKPSEQIWCRSAVDWLGVIGELPAFEKDDP
ncbi:GFA family protein [Rhizobiaceae bacterium n13]|uniref:GFA family protein n=1 Tax=Ferirhizobium litorale TaxID=2927786 RepID=A0AAE3U1K1_9HYPH|nr:GFA family protein [Fererhizobium litorale]MDI7864790.1 GFA family protein [Fererhizobium litorale]MDI7921702.1 GFA family protein [Fererhizobium litorale]